VSNAEDDAVTAVDATLADGMSADPSRAWHFQGWIEGELLT